MKIVNLSYRTVDPVKVVKQAPSNADALIVEGTLEKKTFVFIKTSFLAKKPGMLFSAELNESWGAGVVKTLASAKSVYPYRFDWWPASSTTASIIRAKLEALAPVPEEYGFNAAPGEIDPARIVAENINAEALEVKMGTQYMLLLSPAFLNRFKAIDAVKVGGAALCPDWGSPAFRLVGTRMVFLHSGLPGKSFGHGFRAVLSNVSLANQVETARRFLTSKIKVQVKVL